MQEELAEPALYVKSGYLEVGVFCKMHVGFVSYAGKPHGFSLLVPKKENIRKHCQESCIEGKYITLLVDINGLDVIDRTLPKE